MSQVGPPIPCDVCEKAIPEGVDLLCGFCDALSCSAVCFKKHNKDSHYYASAVKEAQEASKEAEKRTVLKVEVALTWPQLVDQLFEIRSDKQLYCRFCGKLIQIKCHWREGLLVSTSMFCDCPRSAERLKLGVVKTAEVVEDKKAKCPKCHDDPEFVNGSSLMPCSRCGGFCGANSRNLSEAKKP